MVKFIQKNLIFKIMKKFVTSSLFIFWAITVAILVAGLLSYNSTNQNNLVQNSTQTTKTVSGGGKTSVKLTMIELVKHNSAQSCWLLISGKIYDVTPFFYQHPGGARTILPTCGTDATAAYADRGGTGSHSAAAYAMLADYFIGDLNQTIQSNSNTTNSLVNTITTTNSTRAVSNGENEDD
jgi:cytochrome b involved in lipid metabolism